MKTGYMLLLALVFYSLCRTSEHCAFWTAGLLKKAKIFCGTFLVKLESLENGVWGQSPNRRRQEVVE